MDLDERELYSEDEFAAQDSGSEGEASGDEDGLSLGNVELEAAPRMRQPLLGAASAPEPAVEGEIVQPPTWQFSGKRKQRQDGRVLLLFDINGVLMQHRWDGVSHQHDLRPGVHHLLRLVPHFRLGIYSSATRPTVTKALHKLHCNLANFMLQRRAAAAAAGGSGAAAGAAASGGKKKKKKVAAAAAAAGVAAGGAVDADGFPLELPKQLFEVVMARDHCVPAAKEDIEARGGRPWDTVKPLHKYFNALARVALVDDSAHKAAPKEGANMLIMPCWHGPSHPLGRGDACLPLLVDELVAWITPHAAAAAAGAAGADGTAEAAVPDAAGEAGAEAAAQAAAPAADVRLATAGISAKLAAAAQQQLEEARAAGQLTQEQAAAALAVVEAAVSGSAAVAAAAAAAAEAGFDATSPERPAAQQQLRKRPAEQDAAAAGDGTAGPAAEGTEEAGAKPLTKRQRLRQMQQQEQQLAAAASTLLLAAAAAAAEASGEADREGGGSGATLAEINSYLNQWQPKVAAALLNKTAKRALSDAVKAGLVELVPEDASAPAAVPAAAAEAAAPAPAGSSAAAEAAANGAATHSAAGSRYAGRRHRLTSAGAAAVPTKQHLLELAAQCCGASAIAGVGSEAAAAPAPAAPAADAPGAAGLEGKVSGKGKKKRRRGGAGAADGAAEQAQQEGQQAQQAQQAQHAAGGDTDMLDVDAGFFWQKQQQPEPQAEQPAQQQPAPQQGQERQMPAQQQGEEQQADGEGAAAAEAAPETGTDASQPLSMAATRAAVQQGLLLVALAKLQQRRGASSAKLDGWVHQLLAEQHPHLPLRDASAPKRQKAAARSLRAMLQKGMDACEQNGWLVASRSEPGLPAALVLWSIGQSAPPAASEAEVAAAAAALAAAIAGAPGVALPAAQPAAAASGAAAVAAAAAAAAAALVPAAEPAAAGVHAAAPEAAAAAGVQAEGEAAVPLLLDVFEDKGGPPPAAAGAAAGAAAARAAAAAEPAPLAVFEDRAPAPLAGQHAQQPPLEQHAQQAQQQLPQQAQRVQLPGDQEGPRFGPSMTVEQLKAEHKRYLKAVIGQLGAKGSRLPPHQKPVYKQLKKEADRRLKAEVARRGRTGKRAAADVLDRLFEVASGGSDEAWAAAVGQLSEAERAALASQGVELEQYRQGLAARALGGDAGGLGSEREGGGGKEEEEEGEEPLSGSEEEADYDEEERSEWSTASEGEEEEAAAAGPSAARQQPSFFWERAQHAQRAQRTQQGFSPLHFEVEAFAQRATPTQQEAEAVQSAVLAVDAAARELWPHSRVALFGSQATGLALPGSDLDIVVLGVGATLTRAATGFSKVQRKQLSELLEDLLDALLKRKLLSGKAQIIEARVPIIKCKLQFGGGLAADISLGAENGAHAVDFVRRQVLAVPPLRPLCLAVKAFLRERGQNEVFTGGLSSYSLFNMVMAHLQCEGFTPDLSAQQAQQAQRAQQGGRGWRPPPSRPADLQQTLAFLQQLAAGALPAMSEAATAAHAAAAQRAHVHFGDEGEEDAAPGQQQPQADLGVLLWGFFDRFGNRFSYAKQAVSIRLGGVCTKLKAWRQARKPWLLAVEDPQEMGKDVGSGSFGVRDIKEAFAEAAELLAEVCEDLDANEAAVAGATPTAAGAAAAAAAAAGEPGNSAAAAVAGGQQQEQRQGGGGKPSQTLLAGVLDVEAAVGRSAAALRARQAMEKRATAKSQKVLHERIRSGVMLRRQPTAKQQARQQKLARKAERKARIKQDNEEYQERQQAKRERLKGKRQGSRRGAAVEAQWGSTRGQYKDFSDEEWSLRKQKKAKKNKGQQQQQQQQQQGGGAQSNSGGGGSAKKQKLQRKQQQKQRPQQWCQQQRQKQKGKKRQSQGGGQGSGDGGGSASKKARRN